MDPQTLARAQMLMAQGVISPQMYQQMMARAGQPAPGPQFNNGVQPQQPTTNAGQMGQTFGNMVGKIGQKIGGLFQGGGGFASGAPALQTGNGANWTSPDANAGLLAGMPTDL